MAASLVVENDLLAGLPFLGLPRSGGAHALDDELCPVCEHPVQGSHREVCPWDNPPMLLCFLMVEGRRCFTECGACRRTLS
jgi:hypothetical protein